MMYQQNMFNQRIQYVNGIRSAEMYSMGPNQEAILMDSNSPVFYLKTTDAAGMPNIRTFEFKEKTIHMPSQDDVSDLMDRIARLEKIVKEIKDESAITESAEQTAITI